jgi:F-type H+-transporting ATPase subunit gamma
LCGGFNGAVIRAAAARYQELKQSVPNIEIEVAGKRGIAALKFRKIPMAQTYSHFNDQPKFTEVDQIASRYLDAYATGKLDRLDVAYTQFLSSSKQIAVVETLLPLGSLTAADEANKQEKSAGESMYEFLPSAESILQEVVPASFKAKLFKCFLDSAVSEQIARMVAMKSATENASEMIKELSSNYNRARQSQITGEIMEIIGGVEALKG